MLIIKRAATPTSAAGAQFFNDNSPGEGNFNNNGNQFSVVYLRATCDTWASTALHELAHNLGGVLTDAPRHDGQNLYHPRDEFDVLAYGNNTFKACGDKDQNHLLDCGNNDYFNTSPANGSFLDTHWNTARNNFLWKP